MKSLFSLNIFGAQSQKPISQLSKFASQKKFTGSIISMTTRLR